MVLISKQNGKDKNVSNIPKLCSLSFPQNVHFKDVPFFTYFLIVRNGITLHKNCPCHYTQVSLLLLPEYFFLFLFPFLYY